MNAKNTLNLIIALSILSIFAIACTISPWQQQPNSTPAPTPATAATPVQTSHDDNEELQRKIDDLEKKISDQQKQKSAPQVKTVPIIKSSQTGARVSSPNDGFLALRSEPNGETGYRIVQIPHGAAVTILGCQDYRQNIGGRNGRWCRINYAGYTGWAFDGWLVY